MSEGLCCVVAWFVIQNRFPHTMSGTGCHEYQGWKFILFLPRLDTLHLIFSLVGSRVDAQKVLFCDARMTIFLP